MWKQRKGSQETTVQPWGRVLVLTAMHILRGCAQQSDLSSSTRAGAPTQVANGNFRLSPNTWTPDWLEPEGRWLRFPEHQSITHTRPPTNKRRSHTLQPSQQIVPIKTLPWKPSGSLSFWAWDTRSPCSALAIKPLSAPKSDVSVYLASLCVRRTNSDSTTSAFTNALQGKEILSCNFSKFIKITFYSVE